MSVLEFISNLVHWLAIPLAVVLGCLIFRGPIAAFLQKVAQARLPGGIELNTAEAIQNASGAATALASDTEPTSYSHSDMGPALSQGEIDSSFADKDGDAEQEAQEAQEAEAKRREAIETLVNAAFDMGRSAVTSPLPMRPTVSWGENGAARVALAVQATGSLRNFASHSALSLFSEPTVRRVQATTFAPAHD